MTEPLHLLALAGAYLLGSVPFGLVLTRLAGLGDIREIGSGNIGATNVLRTGRKDLALATLLLDAGKGGIAALLVGYGIDPALAPVAGAAAFLGHCFPIYLGFKGGKGVATFFGTLAAVNLLVAVGAGAAWLLSAALFRFSSLGALVAAVVASVSAFYLMPTSGLLAVAGMGVLIFVRHKDNITRLIAGTEPKIGAKKSEAAETVPNQDTKCDQG